MDQPEEPMDLDLSVSFTEVDDKFSEPIYTNIFANDSKNDNVDNPNPISQDIRYENKGGTFTTGIDIFGKEEKLKMEERAKRFGLSEQMNKNNSMEDGEPELLTSLGIPEEDDAIKNLRLNVLHMRGTEEMSTKDVFKYFEDYAPASIEWINDVSCNVVWLDNVTAARALLRLSKRINGLGEKVKTDKNSTLETSNFDNEDDMANEECVIEVIGDDGTDDTEDNKIENSINIKDIKCPLPPGLWRKGIDCPKSKCILLRFATRTDKKQPNAEKMSDYYKKYGNPNFGGIRGILTQSRKRMYKESRHGRKRIKQEESSLGADDTDNKKKVSKNPWGSLSQTWGVNDFTEEYTVVKNVIKDQGPSVKERLGLKPLSKERIPQRENSEESSGTSSESEGDDEWCKRSKVMRMRMHADDEEAKVQKRRLQIQHQVATIRTSRSDDLRSRLRNSRKPPPAIFRDAIQVVVTNSQMVLPESSNNNRSEEEVEENLDQEQEEGEIIDEEIDEEVIEEVQNENWERDNEEEKDNEKEEEEDDDDDDTEDEDDTDESEKEVQGPRGSVIKVVQHKPRVASTVWARLNNKATEESEDLRRGRQTKGDLRDTLRGDLRSRLGKQTRGRSPLRIEVKNDKYANNESDSE